MRVDKHALPPLSSFRERARPFGARGNLGLRGGGESKRPRQQLEVTDTGRDTKYSYHHPLRAKELWAQVPPSLGAWAEAPTNLDDSQTTRSGGVTLSLLTVL